MSHTATVTLLEVMFVTMLLTNKQKFNRPRLLKVRLYLRQIQSPNVTHGFK